MSTYGTIPTSAHPEEEGSSGLTFLSRAKARGRSALAARRPWKEVVHLHAFNLPHGFGDAYRRIRTNLAYFAMNYAIFVLLIVFISLLWHPISLIVFIVMMVAWLFLYFLRDEPLVIFHRTISDKVVLIVLSVLTIVALLFTGATVNIISSVLVGVVVVLVHAAFRKTDDLCLDEEGSGGGGSGGGWYSQIKGSGSS